MKKLSKRQQEVIDLMKTGWELARDTSSIGMGRCWLQHGGACKGGETRNVNATTVNSLVDADLISLGQYDFPIRKYKLTKKGQELGS